MKYASVCSGVEAASLAWMSLGWEAAWFSEIEPFPCAVLKERFPNVPNLGDMTKIQVENLENGDQKFIGADGTVVFIRGGVDLLVGGTPCQSFSVAGKREGLEGASGLAEHFVRLLREMRPRWFVWENVPGALSSRTRGQFDFNFLVREYAKCGYACGWRVLDAQYVRVDGYPRAVPQRRRRVFIVGYFTSDWRYPASVLFEPDSLFGDTPPRRVKGKGVAGDAEDRAGTASVIRMRAGKPGGGKGALVSEETSLTLQAGSNDQTVVSLAAGQAGELGCVGDEVSQTLSRNNGGFSYIAAGSFMVGQGAKAGGIGYADEIAQTIKASPSGGNQVPDVVCVHGSQDPICNTEHANAVNRNNGLENCVCYGIGNGQPCEASIAAKEVSQTLNCMHDHAAVLCYENHAQDSRIKDAGEVSPQLNAKAGTGGNNLPLVQTDVVALDGDKIAKAERKGGSGFGMSEDGVMYTQTAKDVHAVCNNATVRRLLPVECERLMGFPDNWTRIPWKGKPEEECPDSPRYKACGNSMCVNVMRWIGMRIEIAERKSK